MKKNIVLFVLFVLPIVAYLFFASGINSFGKLPIITKNIPNINTWKTLDGKPATFDNKITLLTFLGNQPLSKQGQYFNLIEQIYRRYEAFHDFQCVIVCPDGSQEATQEFIKKIAKLGSISSWHFIFAPSNEIETFYSKLKLKNQLDNNKSSDFVFIVDKKLNIRGRKDKKDYKEGYDTKSPSDLHNNMVDDVKIILAEYRLALKKNHNKLKDIENVKK